MLGDFRHRDVEDVQVLPADEIQQQIERTLEALQNHFQGIRRDIQILRHLQHRLAFDQRQRHFLLLRRVSV